MTSKKFYKIWVFKKGREIKGHPDAFYIINNEKQMRRMVHLFVCISKASVIWEEK